MVVTIQSDMRSALHIATSTFRSLSASRAAVAPRRIPSPVAAPAKSFRIRALSTGSNPEAVLKSPEKPPICTADELHFVSVANSNWRLALWRYHPSPMGPPRSHPLLLLSGVGTNAIGYDLSPESSFARYMSSQGFDTWILEVRGAGLSVEAENPEALKQSVNALSKKMEDAAATVSASASSEASSLENMAESDLSTPKPDLTDIATVWDKSSIATKLTEIFIRLSDILSRFPIEEQVNNMSAKLFDQISKLVEGSQLSGRFYEIRAKFLSLLESRESSVVASQTRDLSQRLVNIFDEAQRSVSPPLFDWQDRLASIIEDIQKQLDLIVKYDWDFDHYLEEDVPAAMEYVRAQCNPKDGKLMAIGHSMGGILLYSMLSRCSHEGRDPKLAAIVTLASSLDYGSSKSTLKLILPLANPAQAFNVPAVPLGTLLAAAYPLSLPWLMSLISAEDMMHPELLEKLVLNNFCTIPTKLLLQLRTAFLEGGLCDRSGTFFYKNHLHESSVPILALAGDQDLICPPEAVEATVKLIPEHLVTYEVLGEPGGAHFAHYDLVGGRLAVERVYPHIIQFLSQNDSK